MFSQAHYRNANPNDILLKERLSNLYSLKKLKSVTNLFASEGTEAGQQYLYSLFALNQTKEGVSDYARTGLKVLCKNANIVFRMTYRGSSYQYVASANPAFQDAYSGIRQEVRVMIVWDTQPDPNNAPTVDQFLKDINYAGLQNTQNGANQFPGTPSITASSNVVNKIRFIKLRDDYMTFGDPTPCLYTIQDGIPVVLAQSGSGSSPNVFTKRYNINLETELMSKGVNDPTTVFQQNSTVITTGALYFIVYYQKPQFGVEITSTVYYEDR